MTRFPPFQGPTLYTAVEGDDGDGFSAWLALREAHVDFRECVVDLSPPRRDLTAARLGRLSPAAAPPVLVDGGYVVFDALAIMEYANDVGAVQLLPGEPLRRAEARAMLAWQRKAEPARLLLAWQAALAASDGPYLYGPLSLADLAIAPRLPGLIANHPPLDSFGAVRAWAERLSRRAAVREWLVRRARGATPIASS